jgi:orotidine-5'-phosphate decarboxylase
MLSIPNFADRLCEAVKAKKSVLCAGLDPQLRYIPPYLIRQAVEYFANGRTFKAVGHVFFDFNRQIIDAIHDIVPCVKPQVAFYEAYGSSGVWAFEQTVAYAKKMGLLVIADAKRGDGGDTADAYADGYLGQVPFFLEGSPYQEALNRSASPMRVDCMTVHGYIGEDCVGRFIARVKENGTGIFVVDKTSFKPNSAVEQLVTTSGKPVWQELAKMVNTWGEGTEGAYGLRNVGVVMGATYPEDAPRMCEIVPHSIFLIPGFGGQGATADDAVVGIKSDGFGGIVNNSRNLTYAWQNKKGKYMCEPKKFADAARLQAIDDTNALVGACKKANKWPHS